LLAALARTETQRSAVVDRAFTLKSQAELSVFKSSVEILAGSTL